MVNVSGNEGAIDLQDRVSPESFFSASRFRTDVNAANAIQMVYHSGSP